MAAKNQLWELIQQIFSQINDIIEQKKDTSKEIQAMSSKLKMLIDLHNNCLEKEKYMRCKQLALMRERNLFLEKCKRIEEVGNKYKWKEENGELLPQVYSTLFSQPLQEDVQLPNEDEEKQPIHGK